MITLLGLIGFALACLAYFLITSERITVKTYAGLNLASCLFIGATLFAQFNLATAILEAFFAVVSLVTLTRRSSMLDSLLTALQSLAHGLVGLAIILMGVSGKGPPKGPSPQLAFAFMEETTQSIARSTPYRARAYSKVIRQ